MTNQTQIIHDMFHIKGGGERLVLTMCDGLAADLLTADIGEDTFDLSRVSGKLHNLNALSQFHGIKTWSLAKAFKNLKPNHNNYQNIIYSGVASPLAVEHYPKSKHVFYCHTPPRFVYDKNIHYASDLNVLKKLAFKQLIKWFRPQYESAVKQMDVILTNSRYVQKRIHDDLNMSSQVVYPPCNTTQFKWIEQGDYYLSLARHDDLKRIDSIIHAFLQMPNKKLVIASGGSETAKLKQLAGNASNIQFTGWLDEAAMLSLLGNCLATIYVPLDEDFGMTPVESMSAGKAVICSDHGGLLETMIDEETGYFVSTNALVNDIIQAVQRLSKNKAISMKLTCENRAKDFDSTVFIKNIKKFL